MTKSEIIDYVRGEVVRLCVPADESRPVDIQVQVTGCVYRPTSQVWFVDLVSGQQVTPIVVKCGASGAATPHQRLPRLTPTVPAPEMIPRQALALQAIDREFMELSDPRFVAVRVLMHDADRRILVMTRIPGDELLLCLHTAALPSGSTARRDLPVYSKMAGEWLRLFHDRVSLPPGVCVYVQPSELLNQAMGWLNSISSVDRAWCGLVQNRISECAENLPKLPRAILHGDYWPGNILVNEGQIGIIDVLGWAEGPIWLDIGYYLLHLRAVDRQLWLHNIAWPDHLLKKSEDEFLAGYFGEEAVDPHARCFFKAFALLAKWSRSAQVLRESTGLQHAKKRALFVWRSAYYRSLMSSFIDMDGA